MPPSRVNFAGFLRYSTTSSSSCFASSQPLTSLNVLTFCKNTMYFLFRTICSNVWILYKIQTQKEAIVVFFFFSREKKKKQKNQKKKKRERRGEETAINKKEIKTKYAKSKSKLQKWKSSLLRNQKTTKIWILSH